MDNIILSVIIPAYNVENYIMDLLHSIYESGIEDNKIELLVVDDGATDHTIEIIKQSEYGMKENLKIIHKENGGHGSCINKGFRVAKGLYTRVIDGDDWVNTKTFRRYVEKLEKSEADMIVDSYSKYYVASNESEQLSEINQIMGNFYGSMEKVLEKLDKIFILMPMITIRTQCYIQLNRLIDEHIFYDDAEYNALCIAATESVEICNLNVYQYRIGRKGQSVDFSIAARRTADLEKIIHYVLNVIEDTGLCNNTVKSKYLERYIAKTAVNCLTLCILHKKTCEKNYRDICEVDKKIAKKNKNVYQLMSNKKIYGKTILYFRRFKRLFYYVYPTIYRRMQ